MEYVWGRVSGTKDAGRERGPGRFSKIMGAKGNGHRQWWFDFLKVINFGFFGFCNQLTHLTQKLKKLKIWHMTQN